MIADLVRKATVNLRLAIVISWCGNRNTGEWVLTNALLYSGVSDKACNTTTHSLLWGSWQSLVLWTITKKSYSHKLLKMGVATMTSPFWFVKPQAEQTRCGFLAFFPPLHKNEHQVVFIKKCHLLWTLLFSWMSLQSESSPQLAFRKI